MSFLIDDIGSMTDTEALWSRLLTGDNYSLYLATHLINTRLGAEIEQNQASKN